MEKTMVKQSTPPPQNPPPPPPAPGYPRPVDWNAPVTRGEFQQGLAALDKDLRAEIRATSDALRAEIKENSDALRAEIKENSDTLRAEIRANSDALRADIKEDIREQLRVLRVSIFWFIALAVSVGLGLLRYWP